MTITGMSPATAPAVVVGAARLVLMASMFLLFGRITGSARTAGIATAIYAGNFNFLYWGAQFSYESLALPLLVVVLMALSERGATRGSGVAEWGSADRRSASRRSSSPTTSPPTPPRRSSPAWRSAYWLVWRNWSLAEPVALRGCSPPPSPRSGCCSSPTSTFGYLVPVLDDAAGIDLQHSLRRRTARALFQGKELEPARHARACPWRRPFSRSSCSPRGCPFGLARPGAATATTPSPSIFVLDRAGLLRAQSPAAGACCLGDRKPGGRVPLHRPRIRRSPGRPSEIWGPGGWSPGCGRACWAVAMGVAIVGGAIAGWPWDLQLSQPLRARADGGTISSPPLALAGMGAAQLPARMSASPRTRRRAAAAHAGRKGDPCRQDARISRTSCSSPHSRTGSCPCSANTTFATWSSTDAKSPATHCADSSSPKEGRRRVAVPASVDRKVRRTPGRHADLLGRQHTRLRLGSAPMRGTPGSRDRRQAGALLCAILALLAPLGVRVAVFALRSPLSCPATRSARPPSSAASSRPRPSRFWLASPSLCTLALGALPLNYLPGGIRGVSWAALLVVDRRRRLPRRRAAAQRARAAVSRLDSTLPNAVRCALLGRSPAAVAGALALAAATVSVKERRRLHASSGSCQSPARAEPRRGWRQQPGAGAEPALDLRIRIGERPFVRRSFVLRPGRDRGSQ